MWVFLTNFLLCIHVAVFFSIVSFPFLFPFLAIADLWPLSFQLFHLFCLFLIAFEVRFSLPCPLTLMENYCRTRSGVPSYTQEDDSGFVNYWSQRLLKKNITSQDFGRIFYLIFWISLLMYGTFWLGLSWS